MDFKLLEVEYLWNTTVLIVSSLHDGWTEDGTPLFLLFLGSGPLFPKVS